jgi:hypothetical protein
VKKFLTLLVSITVLSASFSVEAKDKKAAKPNASKVDSSEFKCVKDYYKTKSPKCIDTLVKAIDPANLQQKIVITHFLAAVFKDDAQMKQRALAINVPDNSKVLLLNALYMAGLKEDFIQYAVENKLEKQLKLISESKIKKLSEIKPKDKAGDNDILLNAYLATGNLEYLQPIFANYQNTSKAELADAIRVAVLITKFGPAMVPKNGKAKFVENLCNKYKCKSKSSKIGNVMTVAGAHWSLLQLAHEEKAVQDAFTDFLDKNKPVMEVIAKENANFTNYAILLNVTPIEEDKKLVEKIISDYESFKPIDTKNITEVRIQKEKQPEQKAENKLRKNKK